MAGTQETLWTGFNNQKLFAERARRDAKGRDIANAIDMAFVSDASVSGDVLTLTKKSNATSGATTTTVTFSGQQNTIEGIKLENAANNLTPDPTTKVVTIPNAVPTGTGETNGLMTAADKAKLDGIAAGATVVADGAQNGYINIDGTETLIYAHATNGANTSAGDSSAQTPAFGGTFKAVYAVVDELGHTTTLSDHTVTIPNTVVTAATGGTGGTAGLMDPVDKEDLDKIVAAFPSSASSSNKLATLSDLSSVGAYEVVQNSDPTTHEPILPSGETPNHTTIYLVKNTSAATPDQYYEWIYSSGNTWECIGDTSMDLTDYWHGAITTSGSGNVVTDISVNSGAVTVTKGSLGDGELSITVGSAQAQTFSANQATGSDVSITIPLASVSVGGTGSEGLMTAAMAEKLDGISDGATAVSASANPGDGTILVDNTSVTVYTHPAGSAPSVTGVPTADATPAFGGTFTVNQVTTDATSHVSAVTSRTITIPDTLAVASSGTVGTDTTSTTGGNIGLMTAADKEKLTTWTEATFDDDGEVTPSP